MRDETIAVHGSYTPDSTRAVAVPIYQTVAHDFVDAAHAGAVFDLETPGFHYNRINNPTVDVLEHRLTSLEQGAGAVALSSGAAAVRLSVRNLSALGSNIVTTPQLYGATYTYFAAVLPGEGVEARFAADDSAEAIEALIDDNTKAVFCESIGNPAGNVVDIEAVADAAHRHGVPFIVDNTVATPHVPKTLCPWGRYRHPLADQVRRRARDDPGGHRHRRGQVRLGRAPRPLPHVQPARARLPRRGLRPRLPRPALRRALPAPLACATRAPLWPRSMPFCCCRAWKACPCASSASSTTPAWWPST